MVLKKLQLGIPQISHVRLQSQIVPRNSRKHKPAGWETFSYDAKGKSEYFTS